MNQFTDVLIFFSRKYFAWLTCCITLSNSSDWGKVSSSPFGVMILLHGKTLEIIASILSLDDSGTKVSAGEGMGEIMDEGKLNFSKDFLEYSLCSCVEWAIGVDNSMGTRGDSGMICLPLSYGIMIISS